jgi:hypothetical protein
LAAAEGYDDHETFHISFVAAILRSYDETERPEICLGWQRLVGRKDAITILSDTSKYHLSRGGRLVP